MLTKAEPLGYSFGQKLPSAHQNHLQDELVKAIDGAGGGTYNPSNPIILGGDGLNMAGPFVVSGAGSADFNGVAVTFNATSTVLFVNGFECDAGSTSIVGDLNVNGAQLTVAAESFFNDTVHIGANDDFTMASGTGTADFFGGTVTISEAGGFQVGGGVPADFNGTVDFNATVDLNAGVDFAAASVVTFAAGSDLDGSVELGLTCTGGMSFASGGTLAIAAGAELQISGILREQGAGRTVYRRYNLPTTNATVSIADGTLFIVPALPGGGAIYTLATTGAQTGDVVCFSAFANTSVNIGGVGPWNLRNNTSGDTPAVWFYFDGSVWQTLDVSVTP